MYLRIVVSAVVTLACACAPRGTTSAQEPPGGRERAECAVYAALLRDEFGIESRAHLRVDERTIGEMEYTGGDFVFDVLQTMAIDPALQSDYRQRNAEPGALESGCFSDFGAASVGGRDDAGDAHHVTFSRVGFTPDMRLALVHTLYSCGPRCGSGHLLLLAREGDRWMVRQKRRTVIF